MFISVRAVHVVRFFNALKNALSAAVLAFVFAGAAASAASVFPAPARITGGGVKYQMSRTADHVLGVDSGGTLHAVYWSGGIQSTQSTPSHVYHQSWTALGGWSPQVLLDDSVVSGQHVGGRHPSLAIGLNGSVNVVWHDYRDGRPESLWIDNIEIYADVLPPGGSFSSTDTRLTTTSALHAGDNSYAPKIARGPDGRLHMTWYDFNEDPSVSDIYLKVSNASGQFNAAEPLANNRLTNQNARGGTPAYTVPDLAIDSAGTRHLAWVGGQGSDNDLYYAELPDGATQVTEQLLPVGLTSFFDPPHIAVDANDGVWIAFADTTSLNHENVVLLHRPAGQGGFDPAIPITSGSPRHFMPDLKIDRDGRVRLVWIDQRSGTHVYYGIYDPARGFLTEERAITTQAGSWLRPALALGNADEAFILFEENVNALNAGEIWFATDAASNAVAAESWVLYP